VAHYDSSYQLSTARVFFGAGAVGLLVSVGLAATAPARLSGTFHAIIIVLMAVPVLALVRGAQALFAYQRLRRIEQEGLPAWAIIAVMHKTFTSVRLDLGGGERSRALPVYQFQLLVRRDEGARAPAHGYRVAVPTGFIECRAHDTLPPELSEARALTREWQVKLHPEDASYACIEWQLASRPVDDIAGAEF
jgi:hypothetical protein